ncbi:hypothetical protein AMR41_19465 [Hapalosiphon sp. MRB220]|nr:hypothetical protein AMR41_19465 [Hapalosiphon sp. MRB220]
MSKRQNFAAIDVLETSSLIACEKRNTYTVLKIEIKNRGRWGLLFPKKVQGELEEKDLQIMFMRFSHN